MNELIKISWQNKRGYNPDGKIVLSHCKCVVCGSDYSTYWYPSKFCSRKCKSIFQSSGVDFEEAKKLYESGMTQCEISEKFGVTQKAIYSVFKRNNYKCRVAAKRSQHGDKNSYWKGSKATYAAYHKRVQSQRGKAFMCEKCGRDDNSIRYDWANITGNFDDTNDYQMLCRSCHFKMDEIKRNLQNNNLVPRINQRKLIDGKR